MNYSFSTQAYLSEVHILGQFKVHNSVFTAMSAHSWMHMHRLQNGVNIYLMANGTYMYACTYCNTRQTPTLTTCILLRLCKW